MAGHEDESLSEITILPDGRVYVFGMTLPLLETLAALPTREGRWQALLDQVRSHTSLESFSPVQKTGSESCSPVQESSP
jgi:hypothetical protein